MARDTMDHITNITFRKPVGPYRTGETAGFENEVALDLVKRGVADVHREQPHPGLPPVLEDHSRKPTQQARAI